MTAEIALPGLAGRVVIVTGAAGGQGIAECRLLAANGAIVVATDLPDAAPAALDWPGELGASDGDSGASGQDSGGPGGDSRRPDGAAGAIVYRRLDVSSPEGWAALAEWITAEYPPPASNERASRPVVHGLVNNAGIPWRARLGDVELADWNRVIAINLTGPMLGIQALLPLMGAGSSIVNVGSAAAVTPHHTVAYTASKWGLRGLSGVAATEFGARGIRSNLVNPGYIDTPMMDAAPAAMVGAQLALTPLGRIGQARDVASVVAFLLSDAAGYITGAEIPVDGGYASSRGVNVLSDALRPAPGPGPQK